MKILWGIICRIRGHDYRCISKAQSFITSSDFGKPYHPRKERFRCLRCGKCKEDKK